MSTLNNLESDEIYKSGTCLNLQDEENDIKEIPALDGSGCH